jgi:hypothetical protein
MKRLQYFVELVMGSNLATLIEFLRFSTFRKKKSEKFSKSENNVICAKPKKVLQYTKNKKMW